MVAKTQEISKSPSGPQEKLRRFQDEVWPFVKSVRGRVPKHLYMSSTKFLFETCDSVAEQGLAGTSLALSKMCATIGKWDLDIRNELVLNLCHILISQRRSAAARNALMKELVDMWKHLSQLKRGSQAHQQGLRFVLPSADEINMGTENLEILAKMHAYGAPVSDPSLTMQLASQALASIFIQYPLGQAFWLIPGLVATLAVLSDPRLTREGNKIDAAPLLNLVRHVFEQHPVEPTFVDHVFTKRIFTNNIRFPPSKLDELQSYVAAQWPQASAMVLKKRPSWYPGHALPQSSLSPVPNTPSSLSVFDRKLRAAYRSRDTAGAESVWQHLRMNLAENPDLGRQMREEPEFLDYCIFVWCAVRRPGRLQETLDVMKQIGVQLTVRSYTSMIHGWKTCKDGGRIEALWDKLVESGLKLDSVIWTERISGLIEANRPRAGIQALAEMQALWKKAVLSEGDAAAAGAAGAGAAAVQPTVEVVNAAVKGLIALDRRAAMEVLAWASREGIEPNIRTFNIMLGESLRCATSSEQTAALLETMKKQKVEPNEATFTIILQQVLGGMEDASAAEQVQAVEQLLSDMEKAGLRANLETYGKMLYAVASLPDGGAEEAVLAVQQHMQAAGLSATPHMVTILVERALARGRGRGRGLGPVGPAGPAAPDAGAAIRDLLRRHNLTSIGQGDQTLWERVMSAHAVTGDVAAAMDVFDQLARAGRTVTSLPCLTDLVEALLARGDAKAVADARHVVGVVLSHKLDMAVTEPEVLAPDARYWRHHFWFLALENGLVEREKAPPALRARLQGLRS